MGRLAGSIAIITGAAQGMGESHARHFVSEGARVVLTDINEAAGHQVALSLGAAASFVGHDVTSAADWAAVVAAAENAFGAVNILINNAAIGHSMAFDELTEDEFRRVVDINQVSVFLGMKAVVPSMERAGRGSIVNISSIAGMVAAPNGLAYIASKFAVRGMSRAAAIDLADRNIRVNCVHPGMIRTPMLAATDFPDTLLGAIPLRRIGEPEDVTEMVLLLASDGARYCTGGDYLVDGGYCAQ